MRFAFPQLLLLCLLSWLPLVAHAQNTAPGDFRFEHLTVDQGLSHSDALAVAQDRAGFIWVGTNRGVDRYDGYELKPYMLPITPDGVAGNRIKVLHVSPATGRLWIGTERAGLNYYDATTDRLVPLAEQAAPAAVRPLLHQLANVSIMALASDRQGDLWVGTQYNGLYVLHFDKRGQLAGLRYVPTAYPSASALAISSLATDRANNVWVGTYNQGLGVVRAGRTVVDTTALTQPVRVLHLDQRGDLWVGLDQRVLWVGAAHLQAGHKLLAQQQPLIYPQLLSLRLDSFGRLWVGTIYGLYVWPAGAVTGQTIPLGPAPTLLLPQDGELFSLNSERVHQVFEDRTQVMWLCTSAGGLNKVDLRQKPFGQLRRLRAGQAALANNYINAIYKEEATNTLWLGTRNGVQAYDLARHTFRSYLNQNGTTRGIDISAILQARNGTLWFGTRFHGLVRLRRQHGREQLTIYANEQLTTGKHLGSTSIERLAEDRRGHLWVATFGDGLVEMSDAGQVLHSYVARRGGLPTNNLTYLLYDPRQDVLWTSTNNAGLLKLRPGPDSLHVLQQFKHRFGAKDGLQVNYVRPLLLDRQGVLWIGTIGGGLHQLARDAQGHETVRSLRNYLPESDVEGLLTDDAGQLWIGGNGLYRYAPAGHHYVRYDVADGLQSNAFKIGAAGRGADGTLYFGGINGVSYFQPAAIQPNRNAPVVLLTALRVNNQPVAVGQPVNGRVLLTKPLSEPQTVIIQPGDKDFSVDFVGLNYVNPQKNRYAYQLTGYNADWVTPAAGQRTASFANLPPGRYTLRVKASNGEGAWSQRPATITFEVQGPWYATGWAYTLYALGLLGAVALYRRVEMRQQKLQSKLALEQFQTEKEKELTNLKLGFFTNISHELRTPLTLILGPMQEISTSPGPVPNLGAKVRLMQAQAQKLLDLVNQLLDFRKVESGHVPLRVSRRDALPILREQYASFQLQAQERNVAYELHLDFTEAHLYLDHNKLVIMLTNLLANAFKYVRDEGRVDLSAAVVGEAAGNAVYEDGNLLDNYLSVTVSDTGVGIAPHELERIFDPYYQASHTNALRRQGTGIGLALARQFAERHGGQLTVASTQGVGTTFELRLPLGLAHFRPEDFAPTDEPVTELETTGLELPVLATENKPSGEAPLPATSPARVLVVEDNDELRQYLKELFTADYAVQVAEDGVAGWDATLAYPPDLIISDVMMPRRDGLELCRTLKSNPKTCHIPLVLLTARTAETHELEGLEMGADDYVSKPFNPSLLQAKVATLLRNRRTLQEFYQRRILLQPSEIKVADADREFLEKAMQVVEQHLSDTEFNVQALVDKMAMSSSAFYRRIKTITGQTAVEFIRDVRLRRAAQLLAQSSLRVSEVSFEVGIQNTRYFREMFQKLYGMLPSEYARQHREVAAPPGE